VTGAVSPVEASSAAPPAEAPTVLSTPLPAVFGTLTTDANSNLGIGDENDDKFTPKSGARFSELSGRFSEVEELGMGLGGGNFSELLMLSSMRDSPSASPVTGAPGRNVLEGGGDDTGGEGRSADTGGEKEYVPSRLRYGVYNKGVAARSP